MAAIENVYIPYGGYWSTPFSKWQNSFRDLHAVKFAAHVAKDALQERDIDPDSFDHAVMGMTTPQESSFYGTPWLMNMIGNSNVPGTQVAQACATGARVMQTAALEIERDIGTASLCMAMDRTSNSPVNRANRGGSRSTISRRRFSSPALSPPPLMSPAASPSGEGPTMSLTRLERIMLGEGCAKWGPGGGGGLGSDPSDDIF